MKRFDYGKLNFEKMGGLLPTIIQERDGAVLSLFYSNKESLKKSLQSGSVWLYSRSRGKVCKKGATSGNVQELLSAKSDCDKDALLFTVNQKNWGRGAKAACHTGKYSCFGTKEKFDLPALYSKIAERKKKASKGSYTKKLFEDKTLLKRKLLEEAAEVALAKTKKELIWESADLLYFLFVTMAARGVTIEEVEAENKRRDKERRARL